jgi:hypothetical protein
VTTFFSSCDSSRRLQLRDPESSFSIYSIIIALEAVAMVIPPILPTAILIGLNVSGSQQHAPRLSLKEFLKCFTPPVIRLKASGIKTLQVNGVTIKLSMSEI